MIVVHLTRYPLDQHLANQLRSMVKTGATRAEVAAHFNVDVRTVARWKDRLGFEWRPRDRPEKRALARLWRSGMTQAEIGRRLGVTATTVRRWRAELGIDRRERRPSVSRRQKLAAFRAEVERLTRKGHDDYQIATRLGITMATVARHRRDAGWFYRSPQPIPLAELRHLFNAGLTDSEIAEMLETTAGTVQVKRSQLGLLRRPAGR